VSGISNGTNYKIFFTNTLQDVVQIVENIKTIYLNCMYVAAKIQLRFGIIWGGSTGEDEGV
jgi:hypothetical protein